MKFIFITSLLFLAGCATNVTPTPTGGSKADGMVTVSYEYGALESPQVNWAVADVSARQRCNAWGYKYAERFSGGQTECVQYDPTWGCGRTRVNVNYQCLD